MDDIIIHHTMRSTTQYQHITENIFRLALLIQRKYYYYYFCVIFPPFFFHSLFIFSRTLHLTACLFSLLTYVCLFGWVAMILVTGKYA